MVVAHETGRGHGLRSAKKGDESGMTKAEGAPRPTGAAGRQSALPEEIDLSADDTKPPIGWPVDAVFKVPARAAQNDPTGIRTPVAGLKGPCPRPLDDGAGRYGADRIPVHRKNNDGD